MRASQRLADRLIATEKAWRVQVFRTLLKQRRREHRLALLGCILLIPAGLALGLGLPSDGSMPSPWDKVGQVAGWWYVLAWAACSYPQTMSNWQRQSVVGFSLDFAIINPIGFVCLAAYYCTLYISPTVRLQYRKRYGVHIGVHINDIVFAVHALALTLIMAAQCCIYERGGQTASAPVLLSIAVLGPATLLYLVLVLLFPDRFTALAFITYLSWIKMAVTLVKYLPQYLLNRQRKSTSGWSIWMVLLDFAGGGFSLFQLCLEAWVLQDLSVITGDAIKFGLGIVSMIYNLLFMLQHYVWYPENFDADVQQDELFPLGAKVSPKVDSREERARGL